MIFIIILKRHPWAFEVCCITHADIGASVVRVVEVITFGVLVIVDIHTTRIKSSETQQVVRRGLINIIPIAIYSIYEN